MSIKTNTTSLQSLLEAVNSLPEAGGVELPTLTNEGSASDLLSDKQLIDQDGNVVTGTFTIDEEISNINSLVDQIQTALDGKAAGGGIELPELSNEGVADDLVVGKELISSNGDIVIGTNPYAKVETDADVATEADLIAQIASALEGKVGSGELTLQNKTITPTTSSQTVTADSGYDGLDTVTVNGDSNLVAENIVSGVSIFGIEGSASSGGSTKTTVSVNVVPNGFMIYYWDKDKVSQSVSANATIEALNGVLSIHAPNAIDCTGNYLKQSLSFPYWSVMFLEDGGTVVVFSDPGSPD